MTVTEYGACGSPTTPTPTPSTTASPTPTPTPSCAFKEWTIQECTTGTCSGGVCTCQGTTSRTVYTNCTVTNIINPTNEIYEDSSLINPFTGDFVDSGSIYNSSGSGVSYVCAIGGPC